MRTIALAAFAVIVAVAPARAEVYPNQKAGVSVDIPKDWKLTGGGDSGAASDPKEEAVVMLITSEATDMKKAGDALDAQLAKSIQDIKWAAQQPITLNTMKGVAIKGTGVVNKK